MTSPTARTLLDDCRSEIEQRGRGGMMPFTLGDLEDMLVDLLELAGSATAYLGERRDLTNGAIRLHHAIEKATGEAIQI